MASRLVSWSHHQCPGFSAIRSEVAIISLIRVAVICLLSELTSVMWAPKASIIRRFSSLKASEKTISNPRPRAAQTRPREIPVVPAVYSTTVPSGGRRPSARAASTAATAMRSFMLPVGLADSSLARMRACPRGTTLSSVIIGVPPTAARTFERVTVELPFDRAGSPPWIRVGQSQECICPTMSGASVFRSGAAR